MPRAEWVEGNDFKTTFSRLRTELDSYSQRLDEVREPVPKSDGKRASGIANKQYVEVYFPAADEDVRVPHSLGVATNYYHPLGSSRPASFYDGERRPEKNALFLRSTVGDVRARFFIIGG